MIVLIDQDGVLADFEQGFLDAWRSRYPDRPFIPPADRTTFYIRDQYPAKFHADVMGIIESPGYYRNLPIVPGAKTAVEAMCAAGHQVYICTSPRSNHRNCVEEKYDWVLQHLGPELLQRLVLTRDKTLVKGDILIDDRPEIGGQLKPEWRQVLFATPANAHIKDLPRISWADWQSVIRKG